MAIICSFTEGISILRNIKHIQHKESNRIIAVTENLAKIGIRAKYEEDNLYIYGNKNLLNDKEIIINTFNDHRIAMSFAIIGLKIGNIIIDNPSCVSKSFPQFWKLLNC
jgi:3-phosphoshikimate 1-carboxyvinyltransferase